MSDQPAQPTEPVETAAPTTATPSPYGAPASPYGSPSTACGAIGRPGFLVVAGVTVVGLVASMAGIIVSDLVEYYGANSGKIAVSESTFVTSNLFNGAVWGSYGSDFGMFVLFGLLGAAGTLLRLRRATR